MTTNIRVRWKMDPKDLKDRMWGAAEQSLEEVADGILEISQNFISRGPINEGTLLRSGYVTPGRGLTYYVGYSAPYAKCLEFGTAPHFPPPDAIREWVRLKLGPNILGVKGKKKQARIDEITQAICWKIYQYGTKPQPFLRPAVEIMRMKFGEIVKRNFQKSGVF